MTVHANPGIRRAASLMSQYHGLWGFAGGWAIDIFLARSSRPHADIDVAVLRDDQRDLRGHLTAARTEKVVAGRLIEWPPDEELHQPIHEVHATWPDGYHLEFLLNEQDRETREWVFRRDARIRRPLPHVFCVNGGIRHLAPEIVLLYKSKAPGEKDDADFDAAIAHMGNEQQMWLREALEVSAPGHRWSGLLAREA